MKNRVFEGVREMDPGAKRLMFAGLGTVALIGTALIFPKSRRALLGAAERTGKAAWAALGDMPGIGDRVNGLVDGAADKLKNLGGYAVNFVDTAASRAKTFASGMNLVGAEPKMDNSGGLDNGMVDHTKTIHPQAGELTQTASRS